MQKTAVSIAIRTKVKVSRKQQPYWWQASCCVYDVTRTAGCNYDKDRQR